MLTVTIRHNSRMRGLAKGRVVSEDGVGEAGEQAEPHSLTLVNDPAGTARRDREARAQEVIPDEIARQCLVHRAEVFAPGEKRRRDRGE